MLGPWHAYVDFIEWCLHRLTEFTGNAGLAIILFTILLKTLLLPLTVKSIKSTAAMQELQPKIKELQKKYAKDRQKLTEETMRLYQEYQINPAAGCLPMIIQIPIFFGLYFAVKDLARTTGDSFLWLPSLNEPDPYKILPIMAGIFQFVQTKMMRPANAPKVTDPQQAMMNTMMNFMPIMVVVFGWTFASGAVLYWATQSVYSVVQQWLITGWGSLKNWFPWLSNAELPEHRRLGHRKPIERKEITGDVPQKGLMGFLQRQAKDAEQRRAGATESQSRSSTESATTTGKRAKQSRAQANVRNVSGGEDDTGTADERTNTTSKTRVMSGPAARGQRRTRDNK